MKILLRILRWSWHAGAGLLTFLALSSYFAYTTAGFDFETQTPRGVDVHYYRLRWDDGSTWAGYAIQPVRPPDRPLDWFDPGGTLLDAPTRPAHRSRWNSLGFWSVTGPGDDPYLAPRYPGATASRWWACPSWLALLAFWSPSIARRLLLRRTRGSGLKD